VRIIRARGASLKATEQPIDTSAAAGKCFLDMLGVFRRVRDEVTSRTKLEVIARAKAPGLSKGGPAAIDAAKVRAMKAGGFGVTDIAKAVKVGQASVYRANPSPDGCSGFPINS
jgi:DNA invertase Pin-like site-specific DNA recombinase